MVVENEGSLINGERLSVSGEREFYYFGDGATKCQEVLKSPNWHYIPDIVPDAQYMGRLAEEEVAKGKGLKANDIAYYEPYYLKEFIAAPSHVKGLK